MAASAPTQTITIGVLALQGAFSEHIQLLRRAFTTLSHPLTQDVPSTTSNSTTVTALANTVTWRSLEVRTPAELEACAALIIPGGESTAIALVAQRSGLLEPLRDFVK